MSWLHLGIYKYMCLQNEKRGYEFEGKQGDLKEYMGGLAEGNKNREMLNLYSNLKK